MSGIERLTMSTLAPLEALLGDDYPERLREMATCMYAQLLDEQDLQSLGRDRLAQLAAQLTNALSAELGGGNFYMHKAVAWRLSQRDRQLVNEFNGSNIPALAHRYRLTETRVRQILAAAKAEEFQRRQPPLFGLEP
ncbi:Mor transcription activator family protein [Ideonella dechloratans]|uniref:Mor transcription activator family protein n=1 Tax=Ideonella dechloratans TaxID=36863 RepID=UPI0035B1789E